MSKSSYSNVFSNLSTSFHSETRLKPVTPETQRVFEGKELQLIMTLALGSSHSLTEGLFDKFGSDSTCNNNKKDDSDSTCNSGGQKRADFLHSPYLFKELH